MSVEKVGNFHAGSKLFKNCEAIPSGIASVVYFGFCGIPVNLIVKKVAHAVVYTIEYLVSVHDLTLWVYKHPHYFILVIQ
ncbi:hypothetical protein CMU79_07105 [Elizabethkingia anophelis]|nr:hypothetical protein [Elizabethkingia anophelis]MDV3618367.1 hypothetical protein [Elizabethkingia anophelis]